MDDELEAREPDPEPPDLAELEDLEETEEIQWVLRGLLRESGLGHERKALVALEGFRKAAVAGLDPATAARQTLDFLRML